MSAIDDDDDDDDNNNNTSFDDDKGRNASILTRISTRGGGGGSGGTYAKVGGGGLPSAVSDTDETDGIMRMQESTRALSIESSSWWRRLVCLLVLLLLMVSLVALWTVALLLSRHSTESCPIATATATTGTASTTFASSVSSSTTITTTTNNNNNGNANDAWNGAASPLLYGLRQGAVATDHSVCSELAAHTILHHMNGTAVDAAVVTALCLGVVNPASSGLGGGAFLLLHHTPADGRRSKVTQIMECRERAPRAASTGMFEDLPSHASVRGGLAIPILGELRCLEAAHARYGTIPWRNLLQPVVDLATRGVVVGPFLAQQIADVAALYIRHETDTDVDSGYNATTARIMRRLLTVSDDWHFPLVRGSLFQNPALAATLHAIAVNGSRALYMDRAEALALEIQQAGGIVTADDIRSYTKGTLSSPLVSRHINGYTLVGVPPPSSGGAVILGAVRFLSGFAAPLASMADTLSMHRIVEACKHVFAIRLSLSDPLYNVEAVSAAVKDLVSGTYMDTLRRRNYRDNTTVPVSQYGGKKWSQLNDKDDGATINATDAKEGDRQRRREKRQATSAFTKQPHRTMQRSFGYLEDHGTSHFSIVDQYGNAVAMTTSINTIFGSHVWSESTGILLSNTMDDFSKPDIPNHYGLRPAESNYIKPDKRPLSSMSPTLVFRERINGDKLLDSDSIDDDTWLDQNTDLVLVIGASGGPKIITSVLQVLLRYIFMGQSLLSSVCAPRVHDQLMYHGSSVTAAEHATLVVPDVVVGSISSSSSINNMRTSAPTNATAHSVLIDVSQRTRAALLARGHRMIDIDFSGTVQAVAIDLETNELSAVSDPRKGGFPAGY